MSNYDQDPNIVHQVQTAVNAQGYHPPLVVDGIYGPATRAGVMWFQGQHGLTQDGIIGDQTMAATISIPTPSGPPLVPPVTALPVLPPGLLSGFMQSSPPPPPPPTQQAVRLAGLNIQYSAEGAAKGLAARKAINAGLNPLAIPGVSIPGPLYGTVPGTPGAPSPQFHAPGTTMHKQITWPTWLGLLAGTAVGTFIGGPPLGSAIGAVIGGAGGFGWASLLGKLHTPPSALPGATMHGEITDYGLPSIEDTSVIAGDIGVPSKYNSLLG